MSDSNKTAEVIDVVNNEVSESTEAPITSFSIDTGNIEELLKQESSNEEVKPSSGIEAKAREQGWVPLEEWTAKGKNPDDWHDARTHVNNRSFLDAIESQGKTIAKLKGMLESMSHTLTKTEERAYKQAIADLEAQKNRARQGGDFTTYEHAVKTIDKINAEHQQQQSQVATTTDPNAEIEEIKSSDYFKRFEAKHPWIHQKTPIAIAKQQFATEVGTKFRQENPNCTNEQLLEFVDKEYDKEFGALPKNRVTPVQGNNRPSSSRSVPLELTREQKNMIRWFKNNNDESGLKVYMKALEQEGKR